MGKKQKEKTKSSSSTITPVKVDFKRIDPEEPPKRDDLYNFAKSFKPQPNEDKQRKLNQLHKTAAWMDIFRSVAEGVGAVAGSNIDKRGPDARGIYARAETEKMEDQQRVDDKAYQDAQLKEALMNAQRFAQQTDSNIDFNRKVGLQNNQYENRFLERKDQQAFQTERDNRLQNWELKQRSKQNEKTANPWGARFGNKSPYFTFTDNRNPGQPIQLPANEGDVYWLFGMLKDRAPKEQQEFLASLQSKSNDPNTISEIKAFVAQNVKNHPDLMGYLYKVNYGTDPYERVEEFNQLQRAYELKSNPEKIQNIAGGNFINKGFGGYEAPKYAEQKKEEFSTGGYY